MKKLISFLPVLLIVLLLAPLGVAGLLLSVMLFAAAIASKVWAAESRATLKWYDQVAGAVNITLANGQLGGTLQTNDGICGMVLTGETESGYTAGTTLLITGMSDLLNQGITIANNPFAVRHCQEFYDQAGEGAQLYLMLVADTVTIAAIADNTNANGAKKLLDFAQGAIKVLGIMTDDKAIDAGGGTVTITNSLNAAVYTAAANMKVMAAAYYAKEWPFRCIIGGSSYNGTPSGLVNETSGTSNNRVAILIGDTQSYDATYSSAALGLLLGRVASIPVQRKISRVKDGPLTNTEVYLHVTPYASAGGDPATIAGKGFITFMSYANVSGFFFSSDPMLTATTDDYSALARGRVIDKAHILAYATFIQEVDDEVPVNDDGTINSGFAKHLQQQIINIISISMVGKGECSAVDCFIALNQNIIQTNTLGVVLKIRPVGYSTTINIDLGFEA
jgi:hypothetical protein